MSKTVSAAKTKESQRPSEEDVCAAFRDIVSSQGLTQRQFGHILDVSGTTARKILLGLVPLDWCKLRDYAERLQKELPDSFAKKGGAILAWLDGASEEEILFSQQRYGQKPTGLPRYENRPSEIKEVVGKTLPQDPIEAWRQEAAKLVRDLRAGNPFGKTLKIRKGRALPLDDETMMLVQEANESLPLPVYAQAINETCYSAEINPSDPHGEMAKRARALLLRYVEMTR